MFKLALLVVGGTVLLFSFGCAAPRLAQSSLGQDELRWQKYIKQSYPAWKPPKTVPPTVVIDDDSPNSDLQPSAAASTTSLDVETPAIDIKEQGPEVQDTTVEVTAPEITPPQPAAAPRYYTVKKGDTLSGISMKMYHTAKKTGVILQHNRNVIKNKNRIVPGMRLLIPPL